MEEKVRRATGPREVRGREPVKEREVRSVPVRERERGEEMNTEH